MNPAIHPNGGPWMITRFIACRFGPPRPFRDARIADHEGLRSCFNIGTANGGVKSNLIADRADIHWSARLLPGQSNDDYLARMFRLEAAEFADWEGAFFRAAAAHR